MLPPLTAYYVMRVGKLPLVPYFPPGDTRLAAAVRQVAAAHAAVLLANHGPVVAGKSLDAAVGAIEELEATARLYLLLQGHPVAPLDRRAGAGAARALSERVDRTRPSRSCEAHRSGALPRLAHLTGRAWLSAMPGISPAGSSVARASRGAQPMRHARNPQDQLHEKPTNDCHSTMF